jgi:hypothetical protein
MVGQLFVLSKPFRNIEMEPEVVVSFLPFSHVLVKSKAGVPPTSEWAV